MLRFIPAWRRIVVLSLALVAAALALLRVVLLGHAVSSRPHPLIVGQDPSAMTVDQAGHHLFVLNYGDGSVSMIDTRRPETARTLAVGGSPNPVGYGIAVAPMSGRVFVVNGGRAVRMLDARTGALLRTIRLPVDPFFVAVDDRARRAFVSESNNFRGNSIVMLDARTGALVRRTIVGAGASALAVDERAGHAFVLNIGANTVSMLDARSGVLLRTIPIAAGASVLARTAPGPLPTTIAIDAQAGRAFVTMVGAIGVLDTRTGALVRTTPVGRVPSDVAVDVRTNHVFVANLYERTIGMLDARTGRPLGVASVPGQPWALAVATTAGRVCVANAGTNTVSVLDARTGRVLRTVPAGVSPLAVTVDDRLRRGFVASISAAPPRVDAPDRGLWRWLRWVPFLPALPQPRVPPRPQGGSIAVLDLAR